MGIFFVFDKCCFFVFFFLKLTPVLALIEHECSFLWGSIYQSTLSSQFSAFAKTAVANHNGINSILKQHSSLTKGQLISKCTLGVILQTKIPTKFFPGFLPQPLKRGQIKKIGAHYTTNWKILFQLPLYYFFDLISSQRLGQKSWIFLEDLKAPKGHFEIT